MCEFLRMGGEIKLLHSLLIVKQLPDYLVHCRMTRAGKTGIRLDFAPISER
jgi:hypothetical protein